MVARAEHFFDFCNAKIDCGAVEALPEGRQPLAKCHGFPEAHLMLREDFKVAGAKAFVDKWVVGVVGEGRFRKWAELSDNRGRAFKAAHLLRTAYQVVLPRGVRDAVEEVARFRKTVLLQNATHNEAHRQTLGCVIELHQDVTIDGNGRIAHSCDADMPGNGEHQALPAVGFGDAHHGLVAMKAMRDVHILGCNGGVLVGSIDADGAALMGKNILRVEEKLIPQLVHHDEVMVKPRPLCNALDLLQQFRCVGFDGGDEVGFFQEACDEFARVTADGALNIEEQGVGHGLDVVLEQLAVGEAPVVGATAELKVAELAIGDGAELGFFFTVCSAVGWGPQAENVKRRMNPMIDFMKRIDGEGELRM